MLSISSAHAFAATTTQDGLEVALATDKEEYSKGEQITATLTVKNTNDTAVTNISLENIVPEGYTLSDKSEAVKQVESLNSGETAIFSVTYVADSKTISNDENIKSDNNEAGESDIVNNDDDPVKTGDSFAVGAVLSAFVIVSVVLVVLSIRKKKGKQLLSLFLCVSIIGSTSAIVSFKANAAETQSKSINIETKVLIDGNSLTINSKVDYIFEAASDDGVVLNNFAADETYVLVGCETLVTFTVYSASVTDIISLYCGNEIVGVMHDDGLDGDVTANDCTFTYELTITPTEESTADYYAKSGGTYSDSVTVYFFKQDLANDSNETVTAIDQKIKKIESKFIVSDDNEENTKNAINVFEEIISYLDSLKTSKKIVDYTIEGTVVEVELPIGIYIYEFNLLQEKQVSVINLPNLQENAFIDSSSTLTVSENGIYSILSAQPYASSDLQSDVFDDAARTIENSNLGYRFTTNADDSTVSVEFMKHLSGYKVIIWDGHGGYSSTLHSFLGTGESSANASNNYASDIANNRVVYLQGGNLGVTSGFFNKYYKNSPFNNSLIYLGACHGAEDNVLANALISNGAKTVLGYVNSVYTQYNRAMCETIFSELVQEDETTGKTKTIQSAYTTAKSVNGNTDPTNSPSWWNNILIYLGIEEAESPAELELVGDDSFRLLDTNLEVKHTGTVSGKICDAATGSSISDVKLTFYLGELVHRNIMLTNSDEGYYSVNLPVGTYRMVATVNGYVDFVAYVDIARNENTYMETFMMVKGGEAATGKASGQIKNALTGNGIGDVTLEIRNGWNNTKYGDVIYSIATNAEGNYLVELPVGNYTVKSSKDGFIDSSVNIYIMKDCVVYNLDATMTPVISANSFRIVLTWGENPRDLDSHIVGQLSDGDYFHVYYNHKSQHDGDVEVCNLDRDDTDSYGPESITLKTTTDSTYYYYIHRYAGFGAISTSNAKINVYQGENLIAAFNAPADLGRGDYWNVFAIKDGNLIIKNTITYSEDTNYAS